VGKATKQKQPSLLVKQTVRRVIQTRRLTDFDVAEMQKKKKQLDLKLDCLNLRIFNKNAWF